MRVLTDEGCYHLIARGNNRLSVFAMPGGYQLFKSLIEESKRKYSWSLYHYCLMSNHIHLLAQVKLGADLPKIMQYILREYSRVYHRKNDYTGYLWEGRYKSFLINKESYFLECGRYIERNPVRAGLVKTPEDYPWSSYGYYAQGKVDSLVDEDWSFTDLSAKPDARQSLYKEFVRLERPYDVLLDQNFV